jgi:RHS repeat-associated protein
MILESVDSSGTSVGTYTYDVYGNEISHILTATTPFQYTGQYTDAESGLVYDRAAYYDPPVSV